MMKSSCRAGLHRELLNSTSSALHPVKRISGMHLKPYLKLQKKERPLEISLDSPRSPPMSQPRLAEEEKPSSPEPSLFPAPSLRKPLGTLSPNTIASSRSHAEGPGGKERRAALLATIHQGDDGEGPLDIWAIVKPGNTKEKVAFFAAQQCGDRSRVLSVKNKSTWDIDGRSTKRRKKSLDIKKAKVHLERMREASGRCYQPEPFACGIEHCSVHNVNDGLEGGFPGRPLSVVEMVAFLEQRASVLLADCSKNCPSASAVTKFPGQPKAAPLASPGPFPTSGVCEAPSEKAACGASSSSGSSSDGEQQAEPLRVLDMVAKLESECLRRQNEREAGSLSRNNSFRRNVGRMLLASGAPPENDASKAPPEAPSQEEPCPPLEGQLSSIVDARAGKGLLVLEQGGSVSSSRGWLGSEKASKPTYPEAAQAPPHSLHSRKATVDCTPKEPAPLPSLAPNARVRESVSISISVTKRDAGCRAAQPSDAALGEDPLPGRLFLLLSRCEAPQECLRSEETLPEECRVGPQGKETSLGDEALRLPAPAAGEPQEAPSESTPQALASSRLKRQRSHDFLETRFKIQQLLEPQQYLLFLPHHIIVKIFGLLPTRSLVALKCTCGYFKFLIGYYNIRPADSRWVRDPRYREDPCKQCKKKYTKGDVSLCRWHPKPYCQALPYGPGYWMCCHRSQRSVPGCRLGLHDNHWVPACHSFNRALHKKPREAEEDC
ncbi:F-box only protein 34 [Podarcis raffonei]|uniref:F-box only protein 34 n=1 Tax=Podarcis raffonei TaxID=65483 RepID=UPI0023290608|nr:F-box only protein 34 [Podarcis raffonei]XP_053246291.1 F-box only protein 34 [Podarcis raffonei]XP_053246377.1 F-box only protein 34 [Podarcis raffonei]